MELFSLTGRSVLVTGARSGIGRAIAVGLAEAGADIIVHGHHDDVGETAELVERAGRHARTWVADFTAPALLGPAVRQLLSAGQIDVLVNNAGTIVRRDALACTPEDWHQVLDVNLTSLWYLTQAVGRSMVEMGRGKVISIASMLSFHGGSQRVAYAASKHAVAGLTKALSNEWATHNVQVNALAPGFIETERPSPLLQDAAVLARIPAGRWGRPADLVGAAVFLASAASDYVTGHVLPVDGGWLAS